MWRPGKCPTACGEFGRRAVHAAANVRRQCRFGARQAGHFEEFPAQLRRQPGDDRALQAIAFLFVQDPGPVFQYKSMRALFRTSGARTRAADMVLHIGEEWGVGVGKDGIVCWHGYPPIAAPEPGGCSPGPAVEDPVVLR